MLVRDPARREPLQPVSVGSITACDSGNTAHRVFALIYEPGGQERASGNQTNTPG